jgi:hypothetical protein
MSITVSRAYRVKRLGPSLLLVLLASCSNDSIPTYGGSTGRSSFAQPAIGRDGVLSRFPEMAAELPAVRLSRSVEAAADLNDDELRPR